MKAITKPLAMLVLVSLSGAAWPQADPIKEVQEIVAKRGEAFVKGDVEVWLEDLADNATFLAARQGFRMDGKPAVRAWATSLFQQYPHRQNQGRQVSYRAYHNGTVVINNGYVEQLFVDRNGNMSPVLFRASTTWVKLDGRWRLVDQHNSRMPGN